MKSRHASSGGVERSPPQRRVSLLETIAGIKGVATTVRAAMGRRAALAEEALAFLRVDGGATYGRVGVPRRRSGGGSDMSDMGLSIAASGLAADTAELDTASNNLSNINTPGYAAEHVNLSPEGRGGPARCGPGCHRRFGEPS